jgi:beta-galactosidase/beta-glucuronidase
MVREQWTNLNGLWAYAIRPAAETKPPEKYDGQILVPFPIESALSGVMKRVGPDQKLWYFRGLDARKPADGSRVLLHFGAVDWRCEAFVNGESVGTHTGGYDPFTFDITDALADGKQLQDLVVAVSDPTDANWQPRGKQVDQPKGIWYTPTTGIWQTVWVEEVPPVSIAGLKIVPDVDASKIRITVTGRGTSAGDTVDIALLGRELEITSPPLGRAIEQVAQVKGPVGQPLELTIPKAKLALWSPDSPFVYSLRVDLYSNKKTSDVVGSYCAMRKISIGKDKEGVTRLMLNNEPVFQYGPLDQGFWPDGLYTAPTDEALKYDLEITKKLGFNMVRKHVKVEPARWYYHCDKLGLLVWQDMPSGDKHAPWNPTGGHNGEEIQRSKESAENFKNEWREIITDLSHFPCIVVWVPFNEAWGQFDTVGVTKFTQELDPTRLVNCASGGNDFPVGHISDLHRYPGPTIPKLEESRAAVLGEYGGLGLPLEGHTWQAKDNWGYRSFQTREELNAAYAQLIYKLRPLIGKGLSAGIYTQTTDVEVEVNGFMTYDREVIKLDPEKTAALHKKLSQPPPKEIVVVPTSCDEPQSWRYTVYKPADGWEMPDFDDASWKEAPGGFGEPSTPGSKVRTEWKTPDIWLRRSIELPKDQLDNLALAIHHDEDAEIHLNGKLLAAVKGYTTEYTVVPLDQKALAAALQLGKNVLAVRCHQTGGGQYIDVGLVRLEETE